MYLSPVLFLLSKTRDAGRRSAELQGPRSREARGLWPRQGPGTLWGTSLDAWAQRGQAGGCGTCAAPAPAPLALLLSVLHARAAERDQQLLSHTGSVGVCSNTTTSYAKEEATANWACSHDPPPWESLFSHPTSPVSYHHFSTVLCSTPLRRRGRLLRGCGLTAETCCPS